MSSFWKDRRAFVTGATGFVGANMVKALTARGAKVFCLERDAAQPNSLDILNLRGDVTVIQGDIAHVKVRYVGHRVSPCSRHKPFAQFPVNVEGMSMRGARLLVDCRPAPESGEVHHSLVALNSHNLGKPPALKIHKWPNQSAGRDGFQFARVANIFAAPLKFRKLKVNEPER